VYADNLAINRARKLDRPAVEVGAHSHLPGSKGSPRVREVEAPDRTEQACRHRVKPYLDLSGR
jgi:hypothetical protein